MFELTYHREDGQTFVWRFHLRDRWQMLRLAGMQAADSEHPIRWADVAMLARHLRSLACN